MRSLFFATLLVAALLGIDLFSGGALRSFVRDIAGALWQRAGTVVSNISDSGALSSRYSLAQENASLRAEVAELQDTAAANDATQAENEQLRSLVQLASAPPRGVSAAVISSFRSSPYGTFLIGAGRSEGVTTGALVLSADGFIIGRVESIQQNQALVLQLFAPGQSIDVLIGAIPLSLQGQGGGVASGEAPHGAQIATGSSVVAPSLGQRPVGVVGNVKSDAASPSTSVLVRVPVNLESLSFVYVETIH